MLNIKTLSNEVKIKAIWLANNELIYFIKHLIRFIKRLPSWLALAWKQENWDYEYLYDLIEFKLKEFIEAQKEDKWHVQSDINKVIKQINICLLRLDRYRNWPNYYDYPMEDIKWVEDPDNPGFLIQVHESEENEIQRSGAIDFEQKNYDKFWKDFLAWHKNWWT